MIFNYENTALRLLENPDKFNFNVGECHQLSDQEIVQFLTPMINEFFKPEFRNLFTKKIQFITRPFYKAYLSSRPKLTKVLDAKTNIDDSGTFIIRHEHYTETIFYKMTIRVENGVYTDDLYIIVFTKPDQEQRHWFDVSIKTQNGKLINNIISTGYDPRTHGWGYWVFRILYLRLFLECADVETKIVNGKKHADHLGQKYANDTNKKIEILDSTYFTTISRTEGFGVRGHFRLQPYGPGNTERRLQWISDFVKQGYTRKAKILRDNDLQST